MEKTLRQAVSYAERKELEASNALQQVYKHLSFCGFENDDEPRLSVCTGGEIILEWHGSEMYIDEVINRMESCGYITRDCFLCDYE